MTFLGLDLGTGSMKAAVWKDGTLEVFSQSYREETFLPGFYQNVPAFSESVGDFIRSLFGAEERREAPECIAVSCHGPSLISLDADGNPMGPMATWQNRDASEEADRIRRDFPSFKKDGTSWEAKCLREFLRNPRVKSFLYPKDYINFLLTGGKGFDLSTASTLTFFDKSALSWDSESMEFPCSLLPEVFESHAPVGETGTVFSRSCGLRDGIPVLAGGIDAYCEALGGGAVSIGDITEGSGTSTCLSVCARRNQGDIHVVPERGLVIALMSNAGSAIEWFRNLTPAASSPEGAVRGPVNTIFLPYLNGERTPFWDDKLQGAFVGLTDRTDRETLRRSVLQGITFAIKHNLELLPADLYKPGGAIFAAGGGAENEYWLQMKADILNHPYIQPVYKDTAPLGDLCLCGYFRKMANPVEELRILRIRKTFYPDSSGIRKRHYEDLYGEFVKLSELLKDSFHNLSDINNQKSANNMKECHDT